SPLELQFEWGHAGAPFATDVEEPVLECAVIERGEAGLTQVIAASQLLEARASAVELLVRDQDLVAVFSGLSGAKAQPFSDMKQVGEGESHHFGADDLAEQLPGVGSVEPERSVAFVEQRQLDARVAQPGQRLRLVDSV